MADSGAYQLETFVTQEIGTWHPVADRSWNHGGAEVLQVEDADGQSWFVKRHSVSRTYDTELNAYRRWVPVLGERAPRLVGSHDGLRVLLLSAVPGEVTGHCDASVMVRAGAVLRRFHGAEPSVPWRDFAAAKQTALDYWTRRGTGLLSAVDMAFTRARLRELDGLPTPPKVPCHLDYGPRNWLVTETGLNIIDFEWSAPEVWFNDLAKLYFGPWRERPDLADAFVDGYGRALNDDDRAVLTICHVFTMVWQLIWSHEHGNTSYEAHCRAMLDELRAADGSTGSVMGARN